MAHVRKFVIFVTLFTYFPAHAVLNGIEDLKVTDYEREYCPTDNYKADYSDLAMFGLLIPGAACALLFPCKVGLLFVAVARGIDTSKSPETLAKEESQKTCDSADLSRVPESQRETWKGLCRHVAYNANLALLKQSPEDATRFNGQYPVRLDSSITDWTEEGQSTSHLRLLTLSQFHARRSGHRTCLSEPASLGPIQSAPQITLQQSADLLLASSARHGFYSQWEYNRQFPDNFSPRTLIEMSRRYQELRRSGVISDSFKIGKNTPTHDPDRLVGELGFLYNVYKKREFRNFDALWTIQGLDDFTSVVLETVDNGVVIYEDAVKFLRAVDAQRPIDFPEEGPRDRLMAYYQRIQSALIRKGSPVKEKDFVQFVRDYRKGFEAARNVQ